MNSWKVWYSSTFIRLLFLSPIVSLFKHSLTFYIPGQNYPESHQPKKKPNHNRNFQFVSLNQELYTSSKSIQSGVNADIDLSSLNQFRLPEKMVHQCFEKDRVLSWDELFTQVNTLIKTADPQLPDVKLKSAAFDFWMKKHHKIKNKKIIWFFSHEMNLFPELLFSLFYTRFTKHFIINLSRYSSLYLSLLLFL